MGTAMRLSFNPARPAHLLGCVMLLVAWPAASQEMPPAWQLSTVEGSSILTYGSDNVEDMPITFQCRLRSGRVRVFVAETNESLRPGRTVTATLKAGSTTSKVAGKTIPNEMAGVPSFEGTLPATDPLFPALSRARVLGVTVASSMQDITLEGIGSKGDDFAKSCKRT